MSADLQLSEPTADVDWRNAGTQYAVIVLSLDFNEENLRGMLS